MPQILHRWRQLQRVSKYYSIRSSMGAVRIASRHSHSYKIAYTIPLCTLSSFTIVRAYEAWEILRWLYRWKKRRKNRRPKKNLGQRRIFLPMQNLGKNTANGRRPRLYGSQIHDSLGIPTDDVRRISSIGPDLHE